MSKRDDSHTSDPGGNAGRRSRTSNPSRRASSQSRASDSRRTALAKGCAFVVAPTYVDSHMLDAVAVDFPDRTTVLAGMAELVPIGRVAQPEDVASAMVFLLSDAAAMIAGCTLPVDGGRLAGLPSRHVG